MFLRVLFLVCVFGVSQGAMAQEAVKPSRTPSHCLAFAQNQWDAVPQVHLAAAHSGLQQDQVAISYVDHSMYMIDTKGGLRVITDYNGYVGGLGKVPDVVTMNKGHTSHFTDVPDEAIRHVLRGWGSGGKVARIELELGEMLIRNVTTDIRNAFTGQEPDGNSIFLFEVAGLCIGHLGHLHHIPTDEQFARIGRVDVVMAAVDGGMTLDIVSMVKVMKRLRASVVLPMHWFGRSTLERFLAGMRGDFDVVEMEGSRLVMSQDLLPSRPTVIVMPPRFLTEYE